MVNQINGMRGYFKTIDNRSMVFLSYEDVLNRLGLISYNKVPNNQTAVMSIGNEDQYKYEAVINWNKVNVYMAIGQLTNRDPSVIQYIPNPLTLDSYIPVELAIELSRQCGNRAFEMELVQQIIPALDGTNAINSAVAIRNQIQSNPNRPTPDNPFQGRISDINNAYRLYHRYRDIIRYVQDLDQFLIYDITKDAYNRPLGGGVWRIANKNIFEPMIDSLEAELNLVAKNDQEREIAQSFGDSYRTDSAIKKIRGIKECIISSSDLNSHPYLLNVINGVIDLRTGKFTTPADPNLYLTQQAPVIYDPYARSPLFEKFITDVLPDPDTREAVLRYLGYCLTGDTSAQKALFIIGSGANGKSTLLKVMTRLLGSDYADSVSINLFNNQVIRSKSETTPERAKIINRRFIQIDEIKAGEVLDVGEFKLLTGSESIPFRNLYKHSETLIDPTHKFIFSGNYLPELRNEDRSDGGFIRRIMMAEFPNKFNVSHGLSIGNMLTMPESLSGILNILVAQAVQYYQKGLIKESPAMIKIRERYISGLTKIVKSILESNYVSEQNSYALHSDLEDQINQVLYPDRLKQGQLKEIMSRLGYDCTKLKSRGDDRDKQVYLGLKQK